MWHANRHTDHFVLPLAHKTMVNEMAKNNITNSNWLACIASIELILHLGEMCKNMCLCSCLIQTHFRVVHIWSNIRLIRDYWCLQKQSFHVCKHPSPCDVTTSWRHTDINCNSMRFSMHKLSISESRPCRSHMCSADANKNTSINGMNICHFCLSQNGLKI